ncbi:MAG: 50S ribosomal protein L28 [bacterium]
MPRKCHKCGKSALRGNKVSHSNRKTRRSWDPNLQEKRVFLNGKWQRIILCVKCLKRLAA